MFILNGSFGLPLVTSLGLDVPSFNLVTSLDFGSLVLALGSFPSLFSLPLLLCEVLGCCGLACGCRLRGDLLPPLSLDDDLVLFFRSRAFTLGFLSLSDSSLGTRRGLEPGLTPGLGTLGFNGAAPASLFCRGAVFFDGATGSLGCCVGVGFLLGIPVGVEDLDLEEEWLDIELE